MEKKLFEEVDHNVALEAALQYEESGNFGRRPPNNGEPLQNLCNQIRGPQSKDFGMLEFPATGYWAPNGYLTDLGSAVSAWCHLARERFPEKPWK